MRAYLIGLLVVPVVCLACGSDGDSDSGKQTAGDGGQGGTGSGAAASGDGGSSTSSGGTGSSPDVACGAFVAGDNLEVCTQTYVSGPGDDGPGSVELAPDGSVVYGGTIAENDFGLEPVALPGGSGAVLRLSADGRTALSLTRVGQDVAEIAISPEDGHIAAVGSFGLTVLDALGSTIVFEKSVGESQHVASGEDGSIAVLSDKHVSVFDKGGSSLGEFDVDASQVTDLAIDSQRGRVLVTGFKQDDGAPCTQLQIPYIRAYSYSGVIEWKNYDWNRTEVGAVDECADSRGSAIRFGRDGGLYYAAESHGGNTVHRRDPKNIETLTDKVVKFDAYNDPYNMNGAAPISFIAKLDPETGALERAQFGVVRLSDSKGNAMRPYSITADENGNVLVGGASACCVENAEQKTINGEHAAFSEYAGGAFILVVPPDFSSRMLWTSLVGPTGGGAEVVSVAAGQGRMAAVLLQSFDDQDTTAEPLLTIDALQSAPGGGHRDALLSVWRGP